MNPNNLKIKPGSNNCNPMDQADPVDVIYLAGVSYCGSTLVSFLLNAHPQIHSVGEMGPLPKFESEEYKCSCGVELVRCPFALTVKDLMEQKYGVPFDTGHWDLRHEYCLGRLRHPLLTGTYNSPLLNLIRDEILSLIPGFKAKKRACARRNAAFIRSALEVSRSRVFVDATKSSMRILFLKEIKGLNVRVLHLVRDPRGFVFSALKHSRKPTHIAAREWVKENKLIDNNLRRLGPHQWIRLRYEVLCLEPEKTLSRLASFAGVESPAALTDVFGEKENHIIGNNMRLSPDALRAVKLDEKWRNALSVNDLNIVRDIAGEQARKYGYDI